jgi:hypothetical protein
MICAYKQAPSLISPKEMIAKYCVMSPQLKQALAKLVHVPVDIRPVYAVEK